MPNKKHARKLREQITSSAPVAPVAPTALTAPVDPLESSPEVIARVHQELIDAGFPVLESLECTAGEECLTVSNPNAVAQPDGFRFVTWLAQTDDDGVRIGTRIKIAFPRGIRSESARIATSCKYPRAHDADADVMIDIPTLTDLLAKPTVG